VPTQSVSFDEAEGVRKRRNGAFFRHRKNGTFILAVESGLHTNAETGYSYRTFAVWKPEAARSSYIHDDELKEKYIPVTSGTARGWWIDKYARLPAIETHETHIIGGAIIPLWQRFKTHEEARLCVVRVTTDDGQRIVGVHIPRAQVGPIIRALGSGRDLREPQEIFAGVLDEGEEVALVSGLQLCRRFLHREPVIELCGADPYKFSELRSLGLLNEQVDWKQRFFVPTDEETGLAVLNSLLARYPIIPSEISAATEPTSIEPQELSKPQTVNLDEWFVPVVEAAQVPPLAPDEIESTEPASVLSAFHFAEATALTQGITEPQLALDFG